MPLDELGVGRSVLYLYPLSGRPDVNPPEGWESIPGARGCTAAPLVFDIEAPRCPAIRDITEALGGRTEVITVPIPTDCADGFNEAYYARPVLLLDPAACSPALHGASSSRSWRSSAPSGSDRTLPPAAGTSGTATCGNSPTSTGRSS
ncbi:hypothetical protein AB5J52_03715 [Streptomyces sp. R39]|uniref:Uncharacterized protein n=1 Tax=Streptomyces sp. R39 TaxID=3238631 RepID=A0AB39QGT5_9ACTN